MALRLHSYLFTTIIRRPTRKKNIIGRALWLKIRIVRRQNIFVSRNDFSSTIFDKSTRDSARLSEFDFCHFVVRHAKNIPISQFWEYRYIFYIPDYSYFFY